MRNLSCEDFLTALASSAPAPGGGAAAAVAGALAAALSSMVANLTLGKEKYSRQEPEVRLLLEQTETARLRLLRLAEDDAAAFSGFMACYRLPRETEAQKDARAEAIRAAARQAAEVPLAIAATSLQVLHLAERLAAAGNTGVVTDAACSALLARAALRCADYNVRINLRLTGDSCYNERLLQELAAMQQQALELENRTLQATDAVIAGKA